MALNEMAGWIAPIATMVAAMMTAANLGARLTGWGFVVFTLGSICWTTVGVSTGQTNLIASNGFLTIVNLVGIWRWLGRQRAYEDGAKTATEASRHSSVPSLFTATGTAGMAVTAKSCDQLGKGVEALIECGSGEVSYVVVSTGGLGGIEETLRAVPRDRVEFGCDRLIVQMPREEFERLPALASGNWPARAEAA